MNFTIADIETLLEAMEAWEDKDAAGEIMTEVIIALMGRKDDAEMQRKMEEAKAKNEENKRNRKERSVLIRAKLIGLLDERRADRLVSQ